MEWRWALRGNWSSDGRRRGRCSSAAVPSRIAHLRLIGHDATRVFDTRYSYTTSAGTDSDQLQKATNNLTGKVTTYTYKDASGNASTRLSKAAQTGGAGGRDMDVRV